jgi:hypothetical protein
MHYLKLFKSIHIILAVQEPGWCRHCNTYVIGQTTQELQFDSQQGKQLLSSPKFPDQLCSGAHPSSYAMGTRGSLSRSKGAAA